MPHDPVKLLHDIADAAEFILKQTRGRPLADYEQTRLVRNAVERSFVIIGEALGRLTPIERTVVQCWVIFPR